MILNVGSKHERRRPFEMFINSKNMEHFQWIVARTRIVSAVFRKGGDIAFLVEELHSVFDPNGGYLQKGGRYVPSLVAEIGDVIEEHMIVLGIIERPKLDAKQQEYVDNKLKELEEKGVVPNAELCLKCNTIALIKMDGCMTCTNCGDSKCG